MSFSRKGGVKPFHSGGEIVTDKILLEREAHYATGDLSGFTGPVTPGPPSDPVPVGRPRLSDEDLIVISFKVPKSFAAQIKTAAEAIGVSRSRFLRDAVNEKIGTLVQ